MGPVCTLDEAIGDVARQCARAKSIWLVGNGGSGTIADHIACDMVLKGWRAFALTNMAVITSYANDVAFEHCFAGPLSRLAGSGDALVAMSCSGESENVMSVFAHAPAMFSVTLSGFKPDNCLRDRGDVNFWVPSDDYGIVQIAHLAVLHAIVDEGR